MIVKCWGVRGTLPTPGEHTIRYGGNTTSVSVEVEDKVLVFDAGSGIRLLGLSLLGTGQDVFIFLSHLHSDHILGFPYFQPLYEPDRRIYLIDYQRDGQPWTLLSLMDGIHFPLQLSDLPCDYRRIEGDGSAFFLQQGFEIDTLPVNHPGGALGYRLTHAGRRFVFIPDNELHASKQTTSYASFVAFCRDADVLCHDAQYLQDDMPAKHGWGHSCVHHVCELAIEARVRHLILIHHDPDRSDDALDALQDRARAVLAPHNIACTAAYEGLTLTVG